MSASCHTNFSNLSTPAALIAPQLTENKFQSRLMVQMIRQHIGETINPKTTLILQVLQHATQAHAAESLLFFSALFSLHSALCFFQCAFWTNQGMHNWDLYGTQLPQRRRDASFGQSKQKYLSFQIERVGYHNRPLLEAKTR